ncbi:MAG: hypothetical protein ACRELU_01535 [Gemmatimonadota bacterium]
MKALRSLLIATGIVVTLSCGSDSPSGPDTEGPIQQSQLECEERGFPCSLSEVPIEILERGDALGNEALAMLEAGASTADAVAFLESQADMTEVEWDETAIWFRLEGGAGVWILREGAFSPEIFSTNAGTARAAGYAGPAFHIAGPEREAKSALVMSPFFWQASEFDDGPSVEAIVSTTRGYEGRVTFRFNSEQTSTNVTLESFMDWTKYDVVHVSTHGKRIDCEAGACRATLVAGLLETLLPEGPGTKAEKLKTLEDIGVTYSFSERMGLDILVLNADFFRKHYPAGLSNTLVFFNACQSLSPQATDLADAIQGAGSVVFGWTEAVHWGDATAAAVALYKALSERGYPAEVAMEHIGELKVGSPTEHSPNAPQLSLSQRSGGGDLRIREVVTMLNPGSGQELTASDLVAIEGTARDDVEDAAPFLVRVDGVKPEFADGMVVQVSIDGVDADPVPLSSGQPNDQDQWTVSGTVPLGYDLTDDKQVAFHAEVNLHSGGESKHDVEATLTGEELLMGKVWQMEAVQTSGYFDGTPHTTWSASTQLTLEFVPGQAPTEAHPRYAVTGGTVVYDFNHTVFDCVNSAPVVTFEANPQTVSVDSGIIFDTTTDPVGYSGRMVTVGPNFQVSVVCGGIVGGTITLPAFTEWFEIEPEEGLLVSQDRRSISGTWRTQDSQTGIYHETQYTITRVE